MVALHVVEPGESAASPVDELVLDNGGPIGDRHYGLTMRSDIRQRWLYDDDTEIRNNRQVSIVDAAELAQIARNLGIDELAPGTIADNICTSGIDQLTSLPLMTRLVFGSSGDPASDGAVIVLSGENLPCTFAGNLVAQRYGTLPHKFPKASFHLRGVTGWVERAGVIRPGTGVRAEAPRPAS